MDRTPPLWQRDEARWADRRAQFVASTTDLPLIVAKTIAYAELGYSKSGIAKRIDRTGSTVGGYFDDISESVGPDALLTKLPGELETNAKVIG